MKSLRFIVAIALLALTFTCLPSANARDRRPTRAPEMSNVTGKLAAAFLAFLGYLAIRRRHAFDRQA